MKKIYTYLWRQKFYVIYFLFVSVLIWTQWFRADHIIAGGDYLPPLDPWGLISKILYAWSPDYMGTESFMEVTKIFPYYLFWGIFDLLGLSPFIIERFWFIFLNLLGGLGMLYFLKVFLPEIKSAPVKLTVVTFYLFNLAVVTEFNHDTALFAYYSLPLVSGAFVMALKKRNLRSLAVFVLASTFLFAVAANPGVFVAVIGALFSFFVIEFFGVAVVDRKKFILFVILMGLSFILLNSFWIFTTLMPLFDEQLVSPFGASHLSWDWVVDKSTRSSFFNLFRMLGKFSWYSGFYSEPTFSFAPVYKAAVFTLSTFLIPVVAFFGLMLAKGKIYYKRVLGITLFLLISFLLAKGGHEPLPDIFHFLFDEFPGFQVFREPYTKLIAIFPIFISCLLAVSFHHLFRFGISRFRSLVSVLLIIIVNLVIVLNAWPLLFGEHTLKNRVKIADYYTEFPAYWQEAGEFIKKDKADITNIYISPPGNFLYTWGYGGHPFDRRLIFAPRVQGRGIYSSYVKDLLLKKFDRSFVEEDSEMFLSLSNLLRLDTFLHRRDVDWVWNTLYYSRYANKDHNKSPGIYGDFLWKREFLEKAGDFGDLALMKRKDGPFGYVSIPENVTYFTSKNVLSGLAYFGIHPFEESDLFLFDDDLKDLDEEQYFLIKERVNTFVVSPDLSEDEFKMGEFSILRGPFEMNVSRWGEYEIYLRKEGTLGNIKSGNIKFTWTREGDEDESVFVYDNSGAFYDENEPYIGVGSVHLKEGKYQMSLSVGSELISPLSYDDLFLVHRTEISSTLINQPEVNKISPTRFDVSLVDLPDEPFFLNFHQTYNSGWGLNEIMLNNSSHFKSNFFENTWLVDINEKNDGDFKILYEPQKYFAVFLLISGLLILLSFYILIFNPKKK